MFSKNSLYLNLIVLILGLGIGYKLFHNEPTIVQPVITLSQKQAAKCSIKRVTQPNGTVEESISAEATGEQSAKIEPQKPSKSNSGGLYFGGSSNLSLGASAVMGNHLLGLDYKLNGEMIYRYQYNLIKW